MTACLRFLRQLRDNLTTYDVVLYGYVLMDNHFHLLARTNRANLSRFMQRLNTSYALYFRYEHRSPGHVLQGRYRAYVHACVMEDDRPLLEAMRASRYAIGSQQYVAEIEQEFEKRRTGKATDRDVALPRAQVDLQRITQIVAEQYGIDPGASKQHGRRAGEAKALALELACRHTGLNQREIGRHYGNITSMAVCMARRRFREHQARDNPRLQKTLAKLEQDIITED